MSSEFGNNGVETEEINERIRALIERIYRGVYRTQAPSEARTFEVLVALLKKCNPNQKKKYFPELTGILRKKGETAQIYSYMIIFRLEDELISAEKEGRAEFDFRTLMRQEDGPHAMLLAQCMYEGTLQKEGMERKNEFWRMKQLIATAEYLRELSVQLRMFPVQGDKQREAYSVLQSLIRLDLDDISILQEILGFKNSNATILHLLGEAIAYCNASPQITAESIDNFDYNVRSIFDLR